MSQNRKAPAFQEYSAAILAKMEFKLMTLSERGLLFTLRLECWENKEIPSEICKLSKYLGFEVADIKAALSDNVKSYLIEKNGLYSCPELDDYRTHLELRRAKQSAGGKEGATLTNSRHKKVKGVEANNESGMSSGNPSSDFQVPRRGSVESLVKVSPDKLSQNQSLVSGDNYQPSTVHDEWVNDYDDSELNDYSRMKG